MKYLYYCFASCLLLLSIQSTAQTIESLEEEVEALNEKISNLRFSFSRLEKKIDDVLFFDKIGDIAFMDKVTLTGPPLGEDKNISLGASDPMYLTNPLRIQTYVFIPRSIDESKKYPLMVLPHGGVHSNFNTFYTHIIRELMAQGYIVVAPEYRGSTGYGSRYYKSIDYGGLEIDDVHACKNYMINNYEIVDPNRVGIMGWSHGGLITLMNLFNYPNDYKVGYAGVPVSDLVVRMGYKTPGYRSLYEVDYHIGKSATEDLEEYKKRSPAWNAEKLSTPLLVHTNTNDTDVTSTEVEYLIRALKAADKDFEYEIYDNVPGGHTFDRIDTQVAKEVRLKVYRFLADYLNPPTPFKNVKALQKAGYRF